MNQTLKPRLELKSRQIQTKGIVKTLGVLMAISLLIYFMLGNVHFAKADSSGAGSPSASASVNSGGPSWYYTSRADASDNSWSYSSVGTSTVTDYLVVTDFAFSIPSGATIDGITVSIERQASHKRFRDETVSLTKDGSSATGSNYASSSSWPYRGSDGTATYGGTADLWGASWTVSDVNSSNFGVMLEVENYSGSYSGYAYVDHISVTIEYTTSGGGSGSATVSPGGVTTDLELWLDANKGITGTTNINLWEDQSGNGNDASQSTSSAKPALESGYVNGNNAVDFDGSGHYMDGSAGGYTDDIFIVLIPDNDISYSSSDQTPISFEANQSDPSAWIGLGSATSGLTAEVISYGTGSSSTWRRGETSYSTTYSAGEPLVINVVNDNTSSATSIYYNQDQIANSSNGSYQSAENDEPYRIGGNCIYWGSSYYNGKIAEVITYSNDLSSTDRKKVASYLAIKYGITLGADYVLSDGVTLWSESSNSTYHNDVAAIARDDDAGLSQVTSKSENSDAAIQLEKGDTMPTDLDAIIWGNNNGTLSRGTSNGSTNYPKASQRTWKVQVQGSPGTVTVNIDLAILDMEGGSASNYALLIDSDGAFTSGATEHTTGASLNGSILTFTGVSFTNGYYFTLGSNYVIVDGDPGGVSSNLSLWLKADAGITGSSNITEWADQSGNGNNAEDASSTTRPSISTAAINYNDAVDFDGVDEYLQGTAGGYTDEVFMVIVPDNDITYSLTGETIFTVDAAQPSTASAFIGLGSSTSGLTNEVVCWGSGSSTDYRKGETSTSTTYSQGVPMLIQVTNDNSSLSSSINVNGASVANSTSGSYEDAENDRPYRIGGNTYYWGGSYFNGKIAEVITYSNDLTSSESNKVESYLAMKYGITKEGDYDLSDGTTIWDASTNADYQNYMMFIGRDDGSELDQRQSLSVSDDEQVLTIGHGSLESSNDNNGNSFASDKSYLILGCDGRETTGAGNADYGTTSNSMPVNGRIKRTWLVEESGDVGTVRLKFDMTEFWGVQTYGSGYDFSKIRLLIDTDDWFSTGAYGVAPTTYNATDETVEFEYNFSTGTSYISLGTIDEWGGAPLPVEFAYFEAEVIGEEVQLNWGTSQELNNDKFVVERSDDASTWVEIGAVKGAGNAEAPIDYSFVDLQPMFGTSYYRLKQVDFDGMFEYTDVRSVYVDRGVPSIELAEVYPNPVNEKLTVRVMSNLNEQLTFKLVNMYGDAVLTDSRSVMSKDEVFDLNLESLSAGNYILLVEGDKVRDQKMIVKI